MDRMRKNSNVVNATEGLTPFRSSPLRRASEQVTSMGSVLNQAREWIATKGHPIDEPVDRDQDGYFTDGEEDEPAEGEPVPHDEVEHLMLAACEQFSQDTELGPISFVCRDTSLSKTKTINHTSNNVTTRQRPPRPKRVIKMEDHDGEEEEEDLFEPLPRRERRKPRIKANFTYLNDMKHIAKVKAMCKC